MISPNSNTHSNHEESKNQEHHQTLNTSEESSNDDDYLNIPLRFDTFCKLAIETESKLKEMTSLNTRLEQEVKQVKEEKNQLHELLSNKLEEIAQIHQESLTATTYQSHIIRSDNDYIQWHTERTNLTKQVTTLSTENQDLKLQLRASRAEQIQSQMRTNEMIR